MTTWFISRHPGAIAWMRQQSITIDRWVEHFDPSQVAAGDCVYGTLPIHLVAQVCSRGARYFHLEILLQPAQRGRELRADEMQALGATVREFVVLVPSELPSHLDSSKDESL